MKKTRVLRAITWLPVGGIERRIVEVLPRLDCARFDVSLVCLRERGPLADELEAAGVRVDCIPFRRRWDFAAIRRLAALMREREIDVVHSHMYRGNVPATVAARLAGVRRVWGQVHNINTWETRRQAWVDRALCRWRAGMIGVSERVCRDIERTLRLPPERVRLIHNGVNLERFGRGEGRSELRAEWGVGPDDVVILFAGRMVEPKRPGDFLDVARRLQELEARRGGSTRLHFVLAGDGPLLPPMRERAASLPAPERARLLGRRDDMPRVMAAADLFILPSSREGFSNALLEAMASGLAIVATDVGGNVEAVRDGLDGRIVPAGDLEALRRETERIAFDADARRAFAESARARAREFSLEAMIDKLQSLYEEPAPERK